MNMSLVVGDLILMIYIHIMVNPTFGKIINVLSVERCVHHLDLIGSMVVLYVVVEMDIGVIVQIPLPPLC